MAWFRKAPPGGNPFPRPVRALAAHTWLAAQPVHRIARPASPSVTSFSQILTTLIDPSRSAASGVMPASGKLTLQIGPQGIGTRWYPAQATVSTTLGAVDTSTVSVYAGTLGVPNIQAAQSYAGGGDSAGFNSIVICPGQYIIAMWTGGTAGTTATIVVNGTQSSLVQPFTS